MTRPRIDRDYRPDEPPRHVTTLFKTTPQIFDWETMDAEMADVPLEPWQRVQLERMLDSVDLSQP